ncbi:MAG: hypothetical protein ACSHXL_04245 [Bacteroidota bacterium]
MKKSSLTLVLCGIFVMLTSVHCNHKGTCMGIVKDATTMLVLDSTKVSASGEEVTTNSAGEYTIDIEWGAKYPELRFQRLGYIPTEIQGCIKNQTVFLEQ